VARAGDDLEAAGELDQLDAVLVEVVVLAQLVERHAHVGQRRLGLEGAQLLDGERPHGREQRCLKQLGEWRHGR
jgi:hypothetical protein